MIKFLIITGFGAFCLQFFCEKGVSFHSSASHEENYRHQFEGNYVGVNTFFNERILTDDDDGVFDTTFHKSIVIAILPGTKDSITVDGKKMRIDKEGIYTDSTREPRYYYSVRFVGDSLYIRSGCRGIGYCIAPYGDVFKGKKN